MHIHNRNKEFIGRLRAVLYDIDPSTLKCDLAELFAPDCDIKLAFPFENLDGPQELYEQAYRPLIEAIPDLERRDFIVMAGESNGRNWVGCGGHYMGVFERPWLDIPHTNHLVAMRYHEFFCIENDQIVEMQALWDIPAVMMQANAWPMVPSLGIEWPVCPTPASNDGIIAQPFDQAKGEASIKLVLDMLTDLGNNNEGVEAMNLEKYWHPAFNWYGPAGIGSMRRISGFRNWHQIPFLNAMPDRKALLDNGVTLGDDEYVGFTAWPELQVTFSNDGFLGTAPSGQKLTMRSLDFWRCENGLIRENWVLVDILDFYHQMGVDVFERMREITVARRAIPIR